MTFDYNDPELARPTAGGFVKWETPGQSVAGDLIEVRQGRNLNGDPVPEWVVRDDQGEDHTITCSQTQLLAKAYEAQPQAGDRIRVTYERAEARNGGKTLKHFTVEVATGGAKGTPAAEPEPETAF